MADDRARQLKASRKLHKRKARDDEALELKDVLSRIEAEAPAPGVRPCGLEIL